MDTRYSRNIPALSEAECTLLQDKRLLSLAVADWAAI